MAKDALLLIFNSVNNFASSGQAHFSTSIFIFNLFYDIQTFILESIH